ncbi:cytochrome P450 [Fusarium oxysporum f. sp. albedinis]|nr:cytochrome P450 [Fusarium oxysporum f. sp. albedinis]
MRRRIGQLYSLSSILAYERFVDRCTDILEAKFRKFSDEDTPVEMGQFFQFYAFDVIGSVTTGHPFGLMEREGDDGIIASLHGATVYSNFVGVVPESHPWIQKTLEITRPLGTKQTQNGLLDFIQFHINQRRKGITPNDKNDFLTKLLKLEEEGHNSHFDTHNSCRSNIAAGSDTTAVTLSAIFYYQTSQ